MLKRTCKLSLFSTLALAACSQPPSTGSGPPPDAEFQAAGGAAARDFKMPSDMVLVSGHDMANGKSFERYQQMVGDARVLGAQLTVHRNRSTGLGEVVIGKRYDNIVANNRAVLSEADAKAIAVGLVSNARDLLVEFMIDPATGRYFYSVEARGDGLRDFLWIDAESGAVQNRYDGLASECDFSPGGIGYLGEQLDLSGLTSGSVAEGFTLDSGRQVTRDLGSWKKPFFSTSDQDPDGCYEDAGRASPGQGALVSAHVNVSTTDSYYMDRGFDMSSYLGGPVVVWAHKDKNYVNAYWDGTKMVFGDGDGVNFRELVSLDIAAHEFTHGVTDFTSNLIYQGESGALNESFSDVMGAVLEFQVEGANGDWIMGEDATIDGGGLRDMSDPTLHGDPAHYCDRYTGTSDNGGVHTNSGISNKAFYLLATDIGLDAAADIFYDGFTALTESATFLNARSSTELFAGVYLANVSAAWDAVGVAPGVVCDTGPDCSADSVCNPDCAVGDDPDCSVAPDCSADTVCNPECATGDDPDCGGSTCELGQPGDSCSANADCCSDRCKGKGGSKSCK